MTRLGHPQHENNIRLGWRGGLNETLAVRHG